MKKKHYITAACFSLMSLFTTSCLDLQPQAQLNDSLVWTTAENFQLFSNQFYGWTRDFYLSGTATYGNGFSDGPHSDFRSDLMVSSSSINVYSQGTNSIPSTDDNYTNLYKRIYYTNILLNRAEGFGDQAAIAVPVGEAKFFRAYLHFELVQIWGNAVLLTQPLDIDSQELYGPRNDRGEVIDQIILDLQDAAELLPENASEEGRLTKGAALAMLSRVALYEGTWQKFHTNGADATSNTERSTELLTIAKDAANQVIASGNYSLFYNEALGNESYRYMFILEDGVQCNPANLSKSANNEYILSHRHRYSDRLSTNITHAILEGSCGLTRKLANMYLCSDGLPIEKSSQFKGYANPTDEYQNRDNRMSNTFLVHGTKFWDNESATSRTSWTDADLEKARTADVRTGTGYRPYKYAIERQAQDNFESMDFPVIRYAEVLLNYAEAAYELNGNISDADLDMSLNLVRQRVNPNMPKLSNSLVSANGLSMREEIRRERTVELIMEGYRIDDLKRWATAETEMPQDQLGVQMTGTWFETNWAAQPLPLNGEGCIIYYTDRTWGDRNYLYPLPSDQMQLNPELGQNPGWGNN